jgi:hypothetical protein
MKWGTCDECIPVVDKLFSLWVRGGNAGGLEAVRIQAEREHLARWLKEHRKRMHGRVVVALEGQSSRD